MCLSNALIKVLQVLRVPRLDKADIMLLCRPLASITSLSLPVVKNVRTLLRAIFAMATLPLKTSRPSCTNSLRPVRFRCSFPLLHKLIVDLQQLALPQRTRTLLSLALAIAIFRLCLQLCIITPCIAVLIIRRWAHRVSLPPRRLQVILILRPASIMLPIAM